ncbi:MAG: hypothetical protein Q7R22_017895 [Verrucomicrobiota bacterium JB025]|nr:hypothetical protein [Verrucomicrobiota bacterium JB025]
MIKYAVHTVIGMSSDPVRKANQKPGEASVCLPAGVAAGSQCGLSSKDILSCLLCQRMLVLEIRRPKPAKGGVRCQLPPAGQKTRGAVKNVVMTELLHRDGFLMGGNSPPVLQRRRRVRTAAANPHAKTARRRVHVVMSLPVAGTPLMKSHLRLI